MQDSLTSRLAAQFKLRQELVGNVVALIDAGNTIPFIARYRKEQTGSMDDQVLRELSERLTYLRSLDARREEVRASIGEQEKLTPELSAALDGAATLAEIEDIYRPYRPKRRTRAGIARERGLVPLAEEIWRQEEGITALAQTFIDEEKGVTDAQAAIDGACDIIAEDLSDDAALRRMLRGHVLRTGVVRSAAATKQDSVYAMYYDFTEPVREIQSHRILAINRGEKEKILKVSVEADQRGALAFVYRRAAKPDGTISQYLERACDDAWKRLIFPSLEREVRTQLTERASEQAIKMFSQNLKPLLMQPPVKNKATMGFDPAYRTGCKIAVVDGTGKLLDTAVVYPTPPQSKTEQAAQELTALINKYGVEVIAIGNGTASKESEIFMAGLIQTLDRPVSYMMVNEAGASVYSASKLGAQEFPDHDVSLRSAVSIARRLQDPLAELVKIDPKSIGVGQYQHDMPPARLDQSLGGVVEDCVNAVGVDLGTASAPLLTRVSGLSAATAKSIVAYREENGRYPDRKTLLKVPKLGPKAYEQCAGFLRVPESDSILDNTGVHPESYEAARRLLAICGYTEQDVKDKAIGELPVRVGKLSEARCAQQCGVGIPTLKDMIAELLKPGRDPRDELPPPMLRSDILDIKDLRPGMKLKGTVRNVIDFGAFVDIGVHQDGLVHISQLADRFVRHPSEIVGVGDIVEVSVVSVDTDKKRIALSMRRED